MPLLSVVLKKFPGGGGEGTQNDEA